MGPTKKLKVGFIVEEEKIMKVEWGPNNDVALEKIESWVYH